MWPNPQFPADLVTFTEEILNRKLHFLYSDRKGSSHPFFEGYSIYFMGDYAVIHCLGNSFSSDMFISKKGCSYTFFQRYCNYFIRELAAIFSFNDTVYFIVFIIFAACLQPSAFPRVLSLFHNTSYRDQLIKLIIYCLYFKRKLQTFVFSRVTSFLCIIPAT